MPDTYQARNGKHYFVLKAGDHQFIGYFETYSAASAMENRVASVITNARSRVENT